MTTVGEPVLATTEGGVLTLELNRPDVLNAFDRAMLERLWGLLTTAARDPAVRAIVLTGAGRGFSAGGDLRSALAASPGRPGDSFHPMAAVFHQCVIEIRSMDKAVIAAINGPAAGGGFSLALACDLRLMSDVAFLQQAYTSSGLAMDGGGTFTLPRLVGLGRALEIVLLDKSIQPEQALELGLVHRVVPAAHLRNEAQQLAESLAQRAVGALGRVKRLLNRSFDRSLEEQLEDERRAIVGAVDSSEGREGLSAFAARRAPDFLKTRGDH
jgi:2-(1,2-epoxy-1,2-dihydrophenyl)acetyl-CoA isomerase